MIKQLLWALAGTVPRIRPGVLTSHAIMKEDILEQLVDDLPEVRGFFTVHNVKFQPDRSDPDYST